MVEEGDRIELVHTTDEYTPLEPGDRGTVTGTTEVSGAITGDEPELQINIEWDSGSTLSLIQTEDSYKILDDDDEP